VTDLKDYLHTDWASMTVNDWIGVTMTVVVFIMMIWAYVYTFHPKNRDRLEAQRYIPFEEDDFRNGEEK